MFGTIKVESTNDASGDILESSKFMGSFKNLHETMNHPSEHQATYDKACNDLEEAEASLNLDAGYAKVMTAMISIVQKFLKIQSTYISGDPSILPKIPSHGRDD